LQYYSALTKSDIIYTFIPWFKSYNIGYITLKRDLTNLITTACKLCKSSQKYGSLENFINTLLEANNSDAKLLVSQFGSFASVVSRK